MEIHARIKATSKLLSGSSTAFVHGAVRPNSQVALFDASIPGQLPRINQACVEQAIRTGIALNGDIQRTSVFERKHYFYGDSPFGFQVTQQRRPIVVGGFLKMAHATCEGKMESSGRTNNQDFRKVCITRIQLEQDTGRTSPVSGHGAMHLLDLNRAGIGMMEIVTEPDIPNAKDAGTFVKTIQRLLRAIGTCDGNMEDGSFRVDVNVSIHNDTVNSQRVEVKNLNSIRAVVSAVDFEASRLRREFEKSGEFPLEAETRAFDTSKGESRSMRNKEGSMDYRFFPEPDLPVLKVTKHQVDSVRISMKDLPGQVLRLLTSETFAVGEKDALNLLDLPDGVAFFKATVAALREVNPKVSPREAANWIINVLVAEISEQNIQQSVLPEYLANLISMVEKDQISRLTAKALLGATIGNLTLRSPEEQVEQKNAWQMNDIQKIEAICNEVLRDAKASKKGKRLLMLYLQGKESVFGYFIGQAMQKSGNRANAKILDQVMKNSISCIDLERD